MRTTRYGDEKREGPLEKLGYAVLLGIVFLATPLLRNLAADMDKPPPGPMRHPN